MQTRWGFKSLSEFWSYLRVRIPPHSWPGPPGASSCLSPAGRSAPLGERCHTCRWSHRESEPPWHVHALTTESGQLENEKLNTWSSSPAATTHDAEITTETVQSTLAGHATFIFDSSVATVPSVTSDDVIACSRKLWSFSPSCVASDPDVSMTT